MSRWALLSRFGSHAEKVKKLRCEPQTCFDVTRLTYRKLCKLFINGFDRIFERNVSRKGALGARGPNRQKISEHLCEPDEA